MKSFKILSVLGSIGFKSVGLMVASAFLVQAQAVTLNGPWIQGAMVTGKAAPNEEVRYNGQALLQSPNGDFVFGLGRDAPAVVELQVKLANGTQKTLSFDVAQRQYATQKIEGVASKHVTPPKAVSARISREAQAVRKARTANDNRSDFLSTFIWPAKGPLTGVYGSQRIYNGVPKRPHYGVDIAGPKGAEVIAPAAGIVTFADDDLYYSGGTLIVDHGHGISSTFIHLSKIEVAVGATVKQGDLIARIGAGGRATGPHLDWRMNWFKARLDPQLLFPKNAKPALQ